MTDTMKYTQPSHLVLTIFDSNRRIIVPTSSVFRECENGNGCYVFFSNQINVVSESIDEIIAMMTVPNF